MDHNNSFILTGDGVLKSNEVFDYESKNNYTVRIKAVSSNGGYYKEDVFQIYIQNIPDVIYGIDLSNSSINENLSINTLVGSLFANDEDNDATHSFELVSGEGDTDNNSFNIDVNSLRSSEVFDYESKNNYTVRRTSSNGGYSNENIFNINILDDETTVMIISHLVVQ